jgi:hypothetical protein
VHGLECVPGCCFAAGRSSAARAGAFLEPSGIPQGAIKVSHVRRANRAFPDWDSNSNFRQGIEFLDGLVAAASDAGLHFGSFQDTPKRPIDMLTLDTWLGRVNFGGDRAAPVL